MSGGGGLAPFDRHPADAGALEGAAADLDAQAARAVDASRLTLLTFLPAVQNWDGIAAAELRAAPRPVREQAYQISDSLAWAAVAIRYWATQVTTFNDQVGRITSELLAARLSILGALQPDGTEIPQSTKLDATQAVENEARRQWHEAYDRYIAGGGRTAAGMLDGGPTSGNVAAASSVGLVPPGEAWNPLSQMWDAFTGNILPPGSGGPLGVWPWLAGRGAAGLGAFTTAMQERAGMRMWHGGLRRRASALPGPSLSPGGWSMLERAARAAGLAGTTTGFLGSLSDRLKKGSSVPSAAAGAATQTATTGACARAGASAGVRLPGPWQVKAVGAIGGGIGGGVVCSPVGKAAGDVAESFTDKIGDQIDQIGDGIKSLGTHVL